MLALFNVGVADDGGFLSCLSWSRCMRLVGEVFVLLGSWCPGLRKVCCRVVGLVHGPSVVCGFCEEEAEDVECGCA